MNEKNIYFAGLFDGEGCISINKIKGPKNNPYKRPGFQLRVSITNTNKEVLEEAKRLYGGHVYERNKNNARTYYNWILASKQCIPFLESVKDYLVIKNEQANIALEFQQTRKSNKTEEEWERDFNYYKKIRILNARYGSTYYTGP